jgi:uncharacterized protein YcfJ
MHLQGYWGKFMADAGNAPGAQQGDVIITLVKPVGGVEEVRVPSNEVTLAAEAGNLIGVQVTGYDGRHLFIAAGNLAGIIDAPASDDEKDDAKPVHRGPGRPRADGAAAAAHDKAEAAHDKSEAAADKAAAQERRPGK